MDTLQLIRIEYSPDHGINIINYYFVHTLYLLCGHELVFRVHIILILWPQISISCTCYRYIVATINFSFFDHVMSEAPYISDMLCMGM